ncbi:hypothetical protein MA16_Dca007796 [Dendrobium catenatum]|uniref:Metallothionein-like protein n=1 Tax=Dendrobium catenatum TaxID=906689 RepID=A0A2I0X5D4_9ASPA|nr:hypothetical protein MA16_Dca007796 [Dendrobium catenatum]
MSCCGGNCGCGSDCKCGSGCNGGGKLRRRPDNGPRSRSSKGVGFSISFFIASFPFLKKEKKKKTPDCMVLVVVALTRWPASRQQEQRTAAATASAATTAPATPATASEIESSQRGAKQLGVCACEASLLLSSSCLCERIIQVCRPLQGADYFLVPWPTNLIGSQQVQLLSCLCESNQ